MKKFRIAIEASAAIGVEIELEAETSEAALEAGERWLRKNKQKVSDAVEELLTVDSNALDAYGKVVGAPFTHLYVAEGDMGYEVVDAFEPYQIR